jgi:hypothetical protein
LDPFFVDLNDSQLATYCYGRNVLFIGENQIAMCFEIDLTPESPITKHQSAPITNEITTIVIRNEKLFDRLSTTTLMAIDGIRVSFAHHDLMHVSHLSSSSDFATFVSDNPPMRLALGTQISPHVPFHGDAISCCAVAKRFRIAV